jgi:hypothetical protein
MQSTCVILYCHLWPVWLYHIPHKQNDFWKKQKKQKKLLNIKRVLIFSIDFSEIFLILRIIQRDIVINVKSLHAKYPLFLSDLNESLNFLDRFSRETRKICLLGTELFRVGGHDETKSHFSQFYESA